MKLPQPHFLHLVLALTRLLSSTDPSDAADVTDAPGAEQPIKEPPIKSPANAAIMCFVIVSVCLFFVFSAECLSGGTGEIKLRKSK